MATSILWFALFALLCDFALAVEEHLREISDFSENDVKASFSFEEAALSSNNPTEAAPHRLEQIKDSMRDMYTSLPKNPANKLTHQVVRYALHRYFEHHHGWFIRGVEPSNETWHGEKLMESGDVAVQQVRDIREWVPTFLQEILESNLGRDGTDLSQLAVVAAALEDLIQKEAVKRLKMAYDMYDFAHDRMLTRDEAEDLMQSYYTGFLGAWDFNASSREDAHREMERIIEAVENWPVARKWFEDLSRNHLKNATEISFESLERLAVSIGEEYPSYNDQECTDLKNTLKTMQGKKPGRVRLSTFYNSSVSSNWVFLERKEYLRALGALDESDPKHPSVIIANYAMARSNCLDASNLYTICCTNKCEQFMIVLERKLSSATGSVESIAQIVSTLPSAPEISEKLRSRLKDIAAHHEGAVPLHGRLFQQWMHHVFPLECPYPHEQGAVNPLSRSEWLKETGLDSEKASKQEMLEHIAEDTCAVTAAGAPCADESVELPWSAQEELMMYSAERSPGGAAGLFHRVPVVGMCAALALLLAVWACMARRTNRGAYQEVDVESGMAQVLTQVQSQAYVQPLAGLALVALAAYAVGLLDGLLLVFVLALGGLTVAADQRASSGAALKKV